MKYFMVSLKICTVNPLRMHNPKALHFSNPPSSKRIGDRRTHAPYPPPTLLELYYPIQVLHLCPPRPCCTSFVVLWSFRPIEDSMEPVESALMRYGWHSHP